MSTQPTRRPANAVSGWDLRALLTLTLFDTGRPLTVDELIRSVTDRGLVVWGRASKVVSDAMRAEMRKGRVRRVARGCYVADRISRSTKHRFRQRTADTMARAQHAARPAPVVGARWDAHGSPGPFQGPPLVTQRGSPYPCTQSEHNHSERAARRFATDRR